MNAYTRSAMEVSFRPEALTAFLDSTAGALELPLREGHAAVVEVAEILERSPVTHTLIGKVRGQPLSEVLLVFHDGAVGGQVVYQAANDHYEFGLAGNGHVAIRRLAAERFNAPCGQAGEPGPETLAEPVAQPGADPPLASSSATSAVAAESAPETEMVTMDTVVGYDSASRIADGGVAGIEARIIASVDHMNLAFANSLVTDTQVVLLGMIEDPDYVFPGRVMGDMGSADELGGLNNESDGYLDTVSNFRKQLGADQNSFVIRDVDGYAGIAYRPGKAMIVARTYMTSTRITFAHEFGHNIGARHSWGDTSSDTLTTISNYGWRFDPPGAELPVRTIMAYDWGWGNGVRVPHFSNPNVYYAGARTGAVDGYNATGDATADQRYVSGGYIGSAGAGFNGSKPLLGARNADYLKANAPAMADRTVRLLQMAPRITSALSLTLVRGVPASYQITADTAVLAFAATGLPQGLALDATSGVISGTCQQTGSFSVSLGVTGSGGTGVATLVLKVLEAQVIVFAPVPPQLATAEVALDASGGASGNPVLFEIVSGPAHLEGTNLVRFSTAGTVVVRASQAASAGYAAAEPVLQSIQVTRAPASLYLSGLEQYYSGESRLVLAATEPAGLPVAVLYDGLETAPSREGRYTVQARVVHPQYAGETVAMMDIWRPQISVEPEPLPPLQTYASVQSFGLLAPGQEALRQYRISNAGTGSLDLGEATLSGTNSAEFVCSTGPETHLGPGASTLLTLRFSPKSPGEKSAVFSLTTNDVDAPLWQMSLSGEADYRMEAPVVTPPSAPEEDPSVAVQWSNAAAVRYEGLLMDAEDERTPLGVFENFVLAPPRAGATAGAFSSRMRLGAKTAAIKGAFEAAGHAALRLSQKDGTDILLHLQLKQCGEHLEIHGDLVWQQTRATVRLVASSYSKAMPVPAEHSGRFTVLLPGQPGWGLNEPGGDGWAAVQISRSGAIQWTGRLADGSAFTRSGLLTDDAGLTVYQSLVLTDRTQAGSLAGRLLFRKVDRVSDLDGEMRWHLPPEEGRGLYPAGFELNLHAIGSRIASTEKTQPLLAGLASTDLNASLNLITGGLWPEGKLERAVSWLAGDTIRHYGHESLKAGINRTTGVLSGSYADPDTGVKILFQGVVIQCQDLAAGQFVLGGRSGVLRIRPSTDAPYPGRLVPADNTTVRTGEEGAGQPALLGLSWHAAAEGGYTGLWTLGGLPTGALENLRVTSQGAFSATLWIQGKKQAIRGAFQSDGSASVQIPANGAGGSMQLDLWLNQDDATACVLTGRLTVQGVEHALCAVRQGVYAKGASSPHAGAYTLAMLAATDEAAPLQLVGDGYGCLKVSASSACTGSLVLADGTRHTFGGFISPGGEWNFYRSIQPGGGFVAGLLRARNLDGVSDLDGSWHWNSPTNAKALVHPEGFQSTQRVVACRYQAPAKGERAWAGLAQGWYNAWARLSGAELVGKTGDALTGLDRVITWNTNNQLLYFGPDVFSLKVHSPTGLVTGSWKDKTRGVQQNVGGVLLQKQSLVTGSYITKSQGGRFWMEPRQELPATP